MNAIHTAWKEAVIAALGLQVVPNPPLRAHLRYVDLDGYWQRTSCEKHKAAMEEQRGRYIGMRERGLTHKRAKTLAIKGHS